MKTEFTPGPWKLEQIINQEVDITAHGTFLGLNPGSGAPDRLDADDYAQFVANAHLIAAAPDLYASLERISHLHRDDMCLCQPINRICAPCQAKAALAKARGEQP